MVSKHCLFLLSLLAVASAIHIRGNSRLELQKEAGDLFDYNVVEENGLDFTFVKKAPISPLLRFERMMARKSHAFDFAPKYLASVNATTTASWSNSCFRQTSATLKIVAADAVEVVLETHDKSSALCDDVYLIANELNAYVHFVVSGEKHTLRFKGLSADEMQDIDNFGFFFFGIEDHVLGSLADIWDTLLLFVGPWTKEEGIKFISEKMGVNYPPRSVGLVQMREEDIPSGTFLSTQRFDGSEVMIQYGTGSLVGHSTIALRLNGSLHVCESTDKNVPAYWPAPYGVICHPWAEWIELAQKAGYSVTLLPLAPELQAKFDETKAQAFVESVLGMPYGYHNFLWGWYDTVESNLPPPISSQFLLVAFSIFDHVKHNATHRIFMVGANKRLGTDCDSFDCIMQATAKANTTLEQLMTIPERDEWTYYDGKSMVCNVFVLETFKAADVFDGIQIDATEFTPKDLYTLKIFDTKKLPGCPVDEYPTCQIMGDWTMLLTGYNSITPYSHMNEHCPSLYPKYERPDGC